jgi:hypothetical protein
MSRATKSSKYVSAAHIKREVEVHASTLRNWAIAGNIDLILFKHLVENDYTTRLKLCRDWELIVVSKKRLSCMPGCHHLIKKKTSIGKCYD